MTTAPLSLKGFDIKQYFSVSGFMLHIVLKQAKTLCIVCSANVQDTTIVEIITNKDIIG